MPHPQVTVAIPTLAADSTLADCLRALEAQTFSDFEIVVIDNSGQRRARVEGLRARVLVNTHNAGFGAAINQAWRESQAPLLAALNDDARPHPQWLAELVRAAAEYPRAGMFASQVRLSDSELDSAGMLLASDGSAKQRGHREPPQAYAQSSAAFFPSGSAALYRRAMLDEVGMFDEDYFLYCEDTDLGLRGRWAGWECVYVAGAVVDHSYSHSAGRASPLKAYLVERNRLATTFKTFPLRMLWKAPFAAKLRYLWHLLHLFQGRGAAAEFRARHPAWMLPVLVFRANWAVIFRLPHILKKRSQVKRTISSAEFAALAARHSISVRRIAEL